MEALWPGQLLFGGGFSEESAARRPRAELRLTDLLRRADFTVGNAALTAEGALGLLIRESDRALWGGRVLICGWGRIGRLLSLDLDALGAEVTVAARGKADRAMARALGLDALDYSELEPALGGFDFIVNTVPARVLTEAMLCCVRRRRCCWSWPRPPAASTGAWRKTWVCRCWRRRGCRERPRRSPRRGCCKRRSTPPSRNRRNEQNGTKTPGAGALRLLLYL